VIHVVASITFSDVGNSLREAFFMFWETLWALILGFTLSGAVQAFVSHEDMQRKLGDHRAKSVARASGYGMVSSSCSYAATAMAKSLFQKGADFVSAMIFMFASTNLVIELGIVLAVLMGWQFMAAEFVGGPIMIILLALTGGFVARRVLVDRARKRLQEATVGGHDHEAMVGVSHERRVVLEHEPWGQKLRSKAAWSDSASYTMADITMLRRELVIGYVVAGFLAVMVPMNVWNTVFWKGHGFWTTVQNAIVGPFIAFISFVCSIGNVPMAAALWHDGIAFGGVISFIFADLIALPLVLIYRKYYGGRPTSVPLVLRRHGHGRPHHRGHLLGSGIDPDGEDLVAAGAGDGSEVDAAWEPPAQQPVVVLVESALPRRMRIREVHGQVERVGEERPVGHLRTAVPGQGVAEMGGDLIERLAQAGEALAGLVAAGQLGEERVTRDTFDQRDHGRLVRAADDEVTFPVAGLHPRFDGRGPLMDRRRIGQRVRAGRLVRAAPSTASWPPRPQTLPAADLEPAGVDRRIDRLRAHPRAIRPGESHHDRGRREPDPQVRGHRRAQRLIGDESPLARSAPLPDGALMRDRGAVGVAATVAADLAAHRRRVPTEPNTRPGHHRPDRAPTGGTCPPSSGTTGVCGSIGPIALMNLCCGLTTSTSAVLRIHARLVRA
jgi:uncharacterized membrane protein YraQ (UPF0718 family)